MAGGALTGLRVLDLSQGIAGAFCTKLLAELGAEVIKVEPPGSGERLRAAGPWPGDILDRERGGLHLYLNGAKKSVTIDTTTPAGGALVRRLLTGIDVLVESAPPGALAAAGLAYADLEAAFPDLIYASVTPFGQSGPWRDYTGDAFIAWASGGLMYVTGDPEQAPLNNGAEPAEWFAGLNLAIGVLAALAYRDAGGGGQSLETSLLEAVAANNEYGTVLYSFTGAIRRRWYSRHAFRYPSDIFPCQDGHVAVLYGRLGLQELAVTIERPDLIDDPLFTDARTRYRRWREFDAILEPYLMSHSAAEIVATGQEFHQPFALVPTVDDLLSDPHLAAREFFETIDHPAAGPLRFPGPSWRMSETPAVSGRAPLLGEHNTELLPDESRGGRPGEPSSSEREGVADERR